jgi:hypothetical protein
VILVEFIATLVIFIAILVAFVAPFVTFVLPFLAFRLLFVTNIEHFKTVCSMISTFGTAISKEICLLSSNGLMKTEHIKPDRAGQVRGDASF